MSRKTRDVKTITRTPVKRFPTGNRFSECITGYWIHRTSRWHGPDNANSSVWPLPQRSGSISKPPAHSTYQNRDYLQSSIQIYCQRPNLLAYVLNRSNSTTLYMYVYSHIWTVFHILGLRAWKNRLTVLLATNLIKGTDIRMETGDHELGCDKMWNVNIDVEWG